MKIPTGTSFASGHRFAVSGVGLLGRTGDPARARRGSSWMPSSLACSGGRPSLRLLVSARPDGCRRGAQASSRFTRFVRFPSGTTGLLKPRGGNSMKALGTLVVMGIVAVSSLVMSASASAAPHCHGITATMTGTSGPDQIVGTNHRDVIVARAGKDIVRSRGGRDVICAGRGDDGVAAGRRQDRVYGGGGLDDLRGGNSADRLFGQRGFDRLLGRRGNDFLSGGSGTDEGFGGLGTDTCRSIEFAHSC
jgi:hypothetical protein